MLTANNRPQFTNFGGRAVENADRLEYIMTLMERMVELMERQQPDPIDERQQAEETRRHLEAMKRWHEAEGAGGGGARNAGVIAASGGNGKPDPRAPGF